MKKILALVLALFFAVTFSLAVTALPSPARAEAPRFAVVDTEKVVNGFERVQETLNQIEEEVAASQAVIDQEEQLIIEKRKTLNDKMTTASQNDLRKMNEEIATLEQQLKTMIDKKNRELNFKRQDMKQEINEQMDTVLAEIAKSLNLELVVAKDFALFATEEIDITEIVIEELNRRYPTGQ